MSSSSRYWCHDCHAQVEPLLPTLSCSQCGNSFIEIIEEDNLPENFQPIGAEDEDENEGAPPTMGSPLRFDIAGMEGIQGLLRTLAGANAPRVDMNALLGQLLGGAGLPGAPPGLNMGDFASEGQFQNILQRLFEAQGGGGAPPASREAIESLEEHIVGPAEVDAQMECSVCQEAYQVGAALKQMPCKHRFHTECIEPWLKIRNTCPVCRAEISSGSASTSATPASAAPEPSAAPVQPPASSNRRSMSPIATPPSFSSDDSDDSDEGDAGPITTTYDSMFM